MKGILLVSMFCFLAQGMYETPYTSWSYVSPNPGRTSISWDWENIDHPMGLKSFHIFYDGIGSFTNHRYFYNDATYPGYDYLWSANPGTWAGDWVHLGFYTGTYIGDITGSTTNENCFVCFSVDWDGFLRPKDTGVGACWNTDGDDDQTAPAFTQIGTVEAIGDSFFKTYSGTNGWETTFTWNK